jgi:hypothetical protein
MQGGLKQQVFISHTGQDEGAKTFAASILRPALERAGVKVYMDFTSIEYGESWKHALVDAAANSQVVVLVLSTHYSTRFWCMLELDLALRGLAPEAGLRGPVVIPVLYNEWEAVVRGPEEVQVDGVASRWQGMAVEWSGEKLLQRLIDEELGAEWCACVDVQRWADELQALQALQHLRRSAFRGKDAERVLAEQVVAAALEHIVRDVHVGDVVGLEVRAAQLLARLSHADGIMAPLGLWLHGFGKRQLRLGCLHWVPTSHVCRRHGQDHAGLVPLLAPVRSIVSMERRTLPPSSRCGDQGGCWGQQVSADGCTQVSG